MLLIYWLRFHVDEGTPGECSRSTPSNRYAGLRISRCEQTAIVAYAERSETFRQDGEEWSNEEPSSFIDAYRDKVLRRSFVRLYGRAGTGAMVHPLEHTTRSRAG